MTTKYITDKDIFDNKSYMFLEIAYQCNKFVVPYDVGAKIIALLEQAEISTSSSYEVLSNNLVLDKTTNMRIDAARISKSQYKQSKMLCLLDVDEPIEE